MTLPLTTRPHSEVSRSNATARPLRRRVRRAFPRLGRAVLLSWVVALLLGGVTGCESTEPARLEMIELVNDSRASAGLPAMERNVELEVKADEWAQELRNACRLSHSVLSDRAPSNWRKLGENVGFGGTIRDVHDAFLESPGHRANILDPSFTQVGSAAVWGQCDGYQEVFVVTVYMQVT